MNILFKYRYLIARRIVQFSVMLLFAGANYFGWTVLKGNLSSGVVLGTVKFSDPYAVLQILATGFWIGTDVALSALLILMVYTILSGRMFCSWICPVNPVTDLSRWLRKIFRIDKDKIAVPRHIRYWLLALSLVLSAITGIAAFEAVSPISFLHRGIIFGTGSGWAVVLMVALFDFGIVKDGWCGHICPLGAFYSIVGKAGLLKVKHTKENCTKCNKCFKICPEVQVLNIIGKQSGFITSGECTNCARCIEVCADDALHFSIRRKIKKENKE